MQTSQRRRLVLAALGLPAAFAATQGFSRGPKPVIAVVTDFQFFSEKDKEGLVGAAGGESELKRLGYDLKFVNVPVGDALSRGRVVSSFLSEPPAISVVIGDDEVNAIAKAIPSIPMVFYCNIDPVSQGLAESNDRPGKNATGVTGDSALNVKPLEFVAEICGERAKKVAVCAGLDWLSQERASYWERAASELQLEVRFVVGENFFELSKTPDWIRIGQFDAAIVPVSQARVTNLREIVEHLRINRVMSVYEVFDALLLGGCAGYEELPNNWLGPLGRALRLVAEGHSPSDIPIRGPDGWAFGANVAALKELGYSLSGNAAAMVSRVF